MVSGSECLTGCQPTLIFRMVDRAEDDPATAAFPQSKQSKTEAESTDALDYPGLEADTIGLKKKYYPEYSERAEWKMRATSEFCSPRASDTGK